MHDVHNAWVATTGVLAPCLQTDSATETLSGLVFYANISQSYHLLPMKSTDVFSVFIAWINLDFGIEVYFYNGMNAYSKT